MAAHVEAVRYTMVKLPLLGQMGVGYSQAGICCLSTARDPEAFAAQLMREVRGPVVRDDTRQAHWQQLLERWLADGTCEAPLDVSRLTPFQQAVLAAARSIPRGSVRPYQWLAKEVGRPGASRAAGGVMARNPIPLLIPCHRVVDASGHIGNYSMGGPAVKAQLLAMEGVDVPWLQDLARRGFRYRGSRRTGRFCYPTCGPISPEDEALFRNAAEAEAAGFTPCPHCRPV